VGEAELDMGVLAVGAACIALWALTARLLARANVSSAMAMVVLGLLVAHEPLDLIDVTPRSETVRLIAEVALALLLFSDASRVNLRGLLDDRRLPTRLLFVGLPLTIALGAGATAILTDLDPWLCALVAATLAPTDAALGAPVVADARVPERIRRTLNVESGLNDGLVTPVVTFFIAGAVAEVGDSSHLTPSSALVDLSVGVLLGVALGVGGGWLLGIARARGWTSNNATAIVVPSLAILCYAAAVHFGGNGFVAAFVGGLAFGSTQHDAAEIGELGEQLGDLLAMVVWLIFGALLVDLLSEVTVGSFALAILALTVLRMVPVAVALVGCGLSRDSVLFVGWFGPRGLASIVFSIIALDALPPEPGSDVVSIVVLTVLLSVVLHGATASPLARLYGAKVASLGEGDPEHAPLTGVAPVPRRMTDRHHRS
jgi:NhaP-type Na+/H+ or K+/H+ antiporter